MQRTALSRFQFLTNISAGGIIDQHSDLNLLQKAKKIAHHLCQHTGINLAGIDVMSDKNDASDQPLDRCQATQ